MYSSSEVRRKCLLICILLITENREDWIKKNGEQLIFLFRKWFLYYFEKKNSSINFLFPFLYMVSKTNYLPVLPKTSELSLPEGGTPTKNGCGCTVCFPKSLPYLWPKSVISPYPSYDQTINLIPYIAVAAGTVALNLIYEDLLLMVFW